MAQKSLFGKFVGLFQHQKSKRGGSTLTASEAIDMQNTYIRGYCNVDSPMSPPYPEIIRQLYFPQTKIVEAALYYLRKIADNEADAAEGIMDDMQKLLNSRNKISAEHKEMIRQTLHIIRQKHLLS